MKTTNRKLENQSTVKLSHVYKIGTKINDIISNYHFDGRTNITYIM